MAVGESSPLQGDSRPAWSRVCAAGGSLVSGASGGCSLGGLGRATERAPRRLRRWREGGPSSSACCPRSRGSDAERRPTPPRDRPEPLGRQHQPSHAPLTCPRRLCRRPGGDRPRLEPHDPGHAMAASTESVASVLVSRRIGLRIPSYRRPCTECSVLPWHRRCTPLPAVCLVATGGRRWLLPGPSPSACCGRRRRPRIRRCPTPTTWSGWRLRTPRPSA